MATNKSLAATARRALLRQGRAILGRYQGSAEGEDLLAAMTEVERQQLEEVHAALERIERGVFGRCEVCYERLDRSRIEVIPWLRFCDGCAEERGIEQGAESLGPEPVADDSTALNH